MEGLWTVLALPGKWTQGLPGQKEAGCKTDGYAVALVTTFEVDREKQFLPVDNIVEQTKLSSILRHTGGARRAQVGHFGHHLFREIPKVRGSARAPFCTRSSENLADLQLTLKW